MPWSNRLLEFRGELAAEDATQNTNGEEELPRCSDPTGAIEGDATGWNDAVDVRMMLEVLTPGMEHAKQTDVGSEVLRVACHFEQRCRAGAEEQVIE